MKFQAFVEQVTEKEVHLFVHDTSVVLPRCCLPPEVQEADILDVVVFVNEKETQRQLDKLRHLLRACGVHRARSLQAKTSD
ncbi:MAG: hypothetical protein GX033_09065 [Firmicutes bacterium]|nr:hypothetical protein [Bacillota bacterium]